VDNELEEAANDEDEGIDDEEPISNLDQIQSFKLAQTPQVVSQQANQEEAFAVEVQLEFV